MATYTGTTSSETITPSTVSPGVEAVPAGSKPSADADAIDGVDGTDTVDGGGGGDTIAFSGAGSVARGGYGSDRITFHVPERSSPVLATAEGGGDNDVIAFDVAGEEDASYSGNIYLRGGDGSDSISGNAAFGFNTSFQGVDVHMYGDGGNDRLVD
jgi:Ca2+-binding RTX toxin-like protein